MLDIPVHLIKSASQGDIDAFEKIYRSSSGYVFAIAYRVTGRMEDAEEVTQDVFVKVYRKLGSFQFRSAFSTWIYRIAMNTAINLYRKRSKERGKNVPFDDAIKVDDHAAKTAGPAVEIEKKDNERLVKSMLESLPPEQRSCVIMKDLEGLKYEEIAKILDINLNTVKSRLSRAREKLVSLFGKGEEER
jgi:RNA polymerase sigma-70 factor, ECF subfamily